MLHGNNSQYNQVSFPDYILHTSQLLQGTIAKKVWLLWKLFSYGHEPGKTTNFEVDAYRSVLEGFLKMILTGRLPLSVLPQNSFSYYPEGYDRLLDYMVASLSSQNSSTSSPSPPPPSAEDGEGESSQDAENKQASAEDLEKLLSNAHLVVKVFEMGFKFCFYKEVLQDTQTEESTSIRYQLGLESDSASASSDGVIHEKLLLPVFTPNPSLRESFGSMLIDQCGLILINSFVPADVRGQMFPLFSSHYQGESFSTFCKQLLSFKGPTVIVIKDKGGHIFGGFASQGWKPNPQFTGWHGQ